MLFARIELDLHYYLLFSTSQIRTQDVQGSSAYTARVQLGEHKVRIHGSTGAV